MRILHITKKYPPVIGGDALAVYSIKKQQIKLGHNVYVATSNCEEIQDKDVLKFGLREHPFNLDRITSQRMISLILLPFWGLKNLRKLRLDIIHSHSADLGFFISIISKVYGVPVINTCHGISFSDKQYSFLKRSTEKLLLKYAGFKEIISVDLKGLQALKVARIKNAVYIPNGVDLDRFQNSKGRDNIKTRFLFVGRLEKQKGVIYLIKAAEFLNNKKNFEVIIVGEGSEADYLRKITDESGLRELVRFKGKIDEQTLWEYYQGCDAFVLPSLWEGMPLTLLEAAAAKMPIIASNVGSISSLFTHEQNALIIEQKSPEALANAMLKLMEDKKLREKLGSNARKLVERFSWENTAKALDEIYIEVAKFNTSRTS